MRKYSIAIFLFLFVFLNGSSYAQEKTLIDFFLPMEPRSPLVSQRIWGDIAPRDTANGLEGKSVYSSQLGKYIVKDWCYWDGSIVKDDEGKYHMYASRWDQNNHHHTGWTEASKGMHAVSDNLFGPYRDQGETWPYWMDGKGHNVIGLRMHDGRYALVGSEIIRGNIWIGEGPNGPFEYQGEIQVDNNGFTPGNARYNIAPNNMANVMVIYRPDGRYMIVPRQCSSLISENGIMGPYKIMSGAAWGGVEGIPQEYMEDPTVWYSDGLYHIVVNYFPEDVSYHLTSRDGIYHWKNRGLAVNKRKGLFRYTNGTINDWETVQRPTVYLEDGVVKAFNFSVIDVFKGNDGANDSHGSKVIVVPFDGVAFGKEMRKIIHEEDSVIDRTPLPAPWKSADVGTPSVEGKSNYNAEDNVFKIRSAGKNINGTADDCRFVYQKLKGDFMVTAQVMMQDNTDPFAKAGVMVRKSLDAGAVNTAMLVTSREGANFQYRNTSGGATDSVHVDGPRAPYWVRILKTGNKIVSSVSSSELLPYTTVGTTELDFGGDSLYVGLALSSNSDIVNITRFQFIDLDPLGQQDKILSHTIPTQIPASYPIQIEVEYLTTQERDINLLIRNVTNWDNGVGSITKTVNGYGKTILEFTPAKTINATDEYEWELNMREKGQNWTTNIEGTQFKLRARQAITPVGLEYITVSNKHLGMNKGESLTLSATLHPGDTDENEIVWKTDNPEVAQVDYVYGTVYALKPGSANIMAVNPESGIADTCKLVVSTSVGVDRIEREKFKVYPNPFSNELTIENPDMLFDHAEILDTTGRILFMYSFKGRVKETICPKLSINKGTLLFLKLVGDSGTEVCKLMYW